MVTFARVKHISGLLNFRGRPEFADRIIIYWNVGIFKDTIAMFTWRYDSGVRNVLFIAFFIPIKVNRSSNTWSCGMWNESRAPRCVSRIRRAVGAQLGWLYQGSGLPCRILLLRKVLSGKTDLLYPTPSIFSLFGAKCRFDNTIFIWYSNFDCLKPVGTCCRISGSTICCYSTPAVTQL